MKNSNKTCVSLSVYVHCMIDCSVELRERVKKGNVCFF